MTVHAVSVIRHNGEDYPVGTRLDQEDEFEDGDLQALVDSGAAVELGKNRKYSKAPDPEDDTNRNPNDVRAELYAKAASGGTAGGADVPTSPQLTDAEKAAQQVSDEEAAKLKEEEAKKAAAESEKQAEGKPVTDAEKKAAKNQ